MCVGQCFVGLYHTEKRETSSAWWRWRRLLFQSGVSPNGIWTACWISHTRISKLWCGCWWILLLTWEPEDRHESHTTGISSAQTCDLLHLWMCVYIGMIPLSLIYCMWYIWNAHCFGCWVYFHISYDLLVWLHISICYYVISFDIWHDWTLDPLNNDLIQDFFLSDSWHHTTLKPFCIMAGSAVFAAFSVHLS